MDTRDKIISPDAAIEMAHRRRVLAIEGSFDVLLARHAMDLQKVRNDTPDAALMIVLTPASVPLLSARARAELVAGLRMVDYVVSVGEDRLEEFRRRLPVEPISRRAADAEQTRLLMDHVHHRHNL